MKAVVKVSLIALAVAFLVISLGFIIPFLSESTIADGMQAGTENFKITYNVITEDVTGTGIVYTPQCFECHLPINFSYSGSTAPDSVNIPLSKFTHTWNKINQSDDISLTGISILVNKTFVSEFNNITTICENQTAVNETNYSECVYENNPYQVQGWRWEWESLSSDLTFEKNKWYVIDYIAERTPRLGGYASDLIPSINSVELSNLAWFNSSYHQRTNFTVFVPSSTIAYISANTTVVIPINWDTATEISEGQLNSNGSDLTIVNQNNTQLSWTWCEYGNPTYGINKANTCIFVKDVLRTDNTTVISFYHDNPNDNVFANSSFNNTFSLRNTVNLVSLIYGGTNGTHIPDREEDTRWGGGIFSKSAGSNVNNATGLKVTGINVTAGTTTYFISNESATFPNSPISLYYWYRTPANAITASAYILTTTGESFGVRTNVAGQPIYYSSSSATSLGSQTTSQWYFGAVRDDSANGIRLSGFADNSFIGSTTTSGTNGHGGQVILFAKSGGTFDFSGILQILAIYNGTLTDNEVNATWAVWSNNSLVVKQGEENVGVSIGANETVGRSAIEQGIGNSSISGTTIYTDQQIYVRYVNTTQQLARFDKVTKFGNQIWAFNYFYNTSSSFTNMQNITPSLYILEIANMSEASLRTRISTFINQTNVS